MFLRRVLLLVGVLAVVFASPVVAQTTTGSIAGKVTDSQGLAIQGATVTLTGPNLQGTRTATTSSLGTYLFRDLPPGPDYRVSVHKQGLAAAAQEAIQVALGQEFTVNIAMSPAGVTETLTVSATPLVDVTQTAIGLNLTANQFNVMPSNRGFQQLTTLAAGVTLEMGDHDSRFNASPTVGASSAPENNYIIDGLSSTDPRYGTSGANLTMNFVQEVLVMTGGYQAEYGRSTGGVFNVITKSGGNQFHGDLFTYFRAKGFTPGNVERRRNKELVTFADQRSESDFGASVGGPIVRDKLWFFGAIDPRRVTNYIGGQQEAGIAVPAPGKREYDTTANIYAGKVTWTLGPAQTLVVTAFGDPTKQNGWLTGPNADEAAALREQRTGTNNFNIKYNRVINSNWMLEGSYGRYSQRAQLEAATDAGRAVPSQYDQTIGGYIHGGFQRVQDDSASRDAFYVKMTNLYRDHDIRYGLDMEMNKYTAVLSETWFNYFGPAFGRAAYIQERRYGVNGKGTTNNTALFIQDNWRMSPKLRVNLGLRWETQRLNSANKVTIAGESDADACILEGDCRQVDGLTLQGHWAPRLGLAYDPTGSGRAKIYGFWGRFYEAVPLNINIRAINGETYIIPQHVSDTAVTNDNWYNPNGSPIAINGPWEVRRTSNLTALTPLDENLKTQYQDEFIIGAEMQVKNVWRAGARYVHRNLARIIEDIGTFTDPTDPLALTGYVIGNPGEGFFGRPYDGPARTYDALELTLTRALRNNWQLFSSIVFAKAEGNHEGLYMSGYDQLDPNINALYDIPSFINNGTGKMRADKPFQFKMHGAYTFDWGLTLSEGLVISSGIPITAFGPEIVNGYGDGTIFLLPRGSEGRTSTFWTFDFHADYRLPFLKGSNKSVSVILDAFNLFNLHNTLEVDTDYVYQGMANFAEWEAASNLDAYGNPMYNPNLAASTFYKKPSLFQSPRAFQIGFKFTY
jgi:outer membrane receptor protein involved in Fe transport